MDFRLSSRRLSQCQLLPQLHLRRHHSHRYYHRHHHHCSHLHQSLHHPRHRHRHRQGYFDFSLRFYRLQLLKNYNNSLKIIISDTYIPLFASILEK